MKLPVRLVEGLPDEPVIFVDGFARAPGLELSHWPGNTTPVELRHELSTGVALNFARLDPAERERLAAGAVAIVNNHYDTDGTLALFAVRHPEAALPHAERLLAAAAAGDFYAAPDDDALALETLVGALADPRVSPLALDGLAELARQQRATDFLLAELPRLLAGGLTDFRALYEDRVAAIREDEALLELGERRAFPDADLTAWIVAAPVGTEVVDPMRHALFGATESDRVLALGTSSAGTSCRLVISTRSWFDLPGRTKRPRPLLKALVRTLNEREGTSAGDAHAWRSHPQVGASPELWFGGNSAERFADRAEVLGSSRLTPQAILDVLVPALTRA